VIGAAVVVAKIAAPQHPLFLQRQGAYDASMSTPTLASGADFICRHCGAVYVVSYTELPIADSGSTYCDVCRRQMATSATAGCYPIDRGRLRFD
jgi:hypothetical protein